MQMLSGGGLLAYRLADLVLHDEIGAVMEEVVGRSLLPLREKEGPGPKRPGG